MPNLLEEKRKIIDRGQEEERKAWSRIEKERRRVAIGQKAIKKIAIYHVSIRSIFSLHGNQVRDGHWT